MKIIIIILQAILNLVCKRRDLIANRSKIPPEYRDDVVVWYSPKKQRLTNYDVIESYAEDFTGWEYRDYRGTAKITNNAIVITNVVETNNIVEDAKEPYSDLTIRVTGVTEDKYLIVAATKEYPDLFGGVTIGNGKIKIGIPGIDKDIVLEAADIDHFKSCLK